MPNYITHSLKIACFTAIALIMVACGSNPNRGVSELANSSQNLDAILREASQAEPEQKNPLLVQASGILLAGQRPEKALELLLHIDNRYLNSQQKDTYHLYYGEVLLSDQQEESNLAAMGQLLSVSKPNAHSVEWQIRYFQSLSDAYFANHNYLESARQRIALDDLIDQQLALEQNNEKIWSAINEMSPEFLQQTISDFNSKRENGWLEIVYINKMWGNQPDRLLKEMEQWKLRFPLHSATVVQPKSLQRVALVETIKPKKIAVLLPLSGRLARPGRMVHDGLVAAHYQQQDMNDIPTIQFYDTAKSFSGLASYKEAIADGADFIIGPISKQAIDEIVEQDSLATPTLFLNTSNKDTQRHSQIFQFVLSIEDEAIQAAHRAWENGYRKGIAFLPSDSRGRRAQKAFKEYFEQLGGELIDTQEYDDIKLLNKNVQNLLRVNASIERKRNLEKILGRNLEFEIRRRQDADFIFMLSQPRAARQIKPFIDFYFALDLPVIATKRVYSGKNDPQLDNDLNGIEFSDVPLYISQQSDILGTRNTIKEIDPKILNGSNGRFFAIGFDAYQIISQITKLQAFPDYRWYGLSGEIGVDENGFVHRYLTWAKFKNGIPQVTKERQSPIIQQSKQPLSFVGKREILSKGH